MGGDDWFSGAEKVDLDLIRSEVARLAQLTPLEYEAERVAVAKRLDVRTSFLDREVEKARPKCAPAEEGGEIIETLEPWPDPVDGASLAEEIRSCLRAYVVFTNAADADALTLWIVGSHLMDVWQLFPKVLIESPTKRCGKTTLLETIEVFVPRAMMCSNISAAVLFRCIEKYQPTLLVDEADRFLRDKDEINGIINAAHSRRGAYVLRCVGDDNEVKRFPVWCAQVFAGIGKQADTLVDRSLVIGLRRKLPDDKVSRRPADLFEQMLRVRRQLARWSADHKVRIGAMESEPPACGNDRRRDNFTPLWRIAQALGAPWPDRLASAYLAQAATEDDSDEPAGVMLLSDLASIFAQRRAARLQSADLVVDLVNMEDRPWAEWRHGRPLTPQTIAKLLRPFCVKQRPTRVGTQVFKAYDAEDIKATFTRYRQDATQSGSHSYTAENM